MTRLRIVHPYSSDGDVVDRVDRAHAIAEAIPPAWTDVWIARYPNSHILAVGVDAAGRRQYVYHPAWRAHQDRLKFDRIRLLASALPGARSAVTRHLRLAGLPQRRVLAAAFRILDTAAIRIGNEEYATAHGSRGLTTLQRRHARVDGDRVTFSFPAKSRQRALIEVEDPELAIAVGILVGGPAAARLLSWGNERIPVRATEVNDYLRSHLGIDVSAKDFRTLKGTLVAADALARIDGQPISDARAIREACAAAATVLGNTPSIARQSYIDPEIFDRFRTNETMRLDRSPESAYLELIDVSSPPV